MSEPGSTSGTPKRLSTLSSPSTDNFSEPFLITPASHTRPRRWLLAGSYCVLFTRYAIATFLCTFFPQYATHIGMSDTMFSAIFAAYPLGMAITSIFAAQACKWMGTRSACSFGLSATTVLTFLFGLGPTFTSSRPALEAIFLTSYFANGLLGALCETSCIITVSARFRENPGTIMASINTVCTLGCMLGPVLGGALFDAGDAAGGDAWAFRLPFFVASIIPVALLPLVPLFMPQLHIGDGADPDASAQLAHSDAAASAAAATLSLPSQEASFSADAVVLSALNCSCEWQPDNGFDGFASAISLACLVYAFVLVVAAALNWRGPNSRYLPGRGLPDELAVQPLDLQVEFDPSPMRDARSDSTTVQPLQVVPPLADLAPTFGRD